MTSKYIDIHTDAHTFIHDLYTRTRARMSCVHADQRECGLRDPQGGVEGGADPGGAVRREPLVDPKVLHGEGAGEKRAMLYVI